MAAQEAAAGKAPSTEVDTALLLSPNNLTLRDKSHGNCPNDDNELTGKSMEINADNSKSDGTCILPKYITQVSKLVHRCALCQVNLRSSRSVAEHVKGSRHDKNLQSQISGEPSIGVLPEGVIHIKHQMYKCSVCNKQFFGMKCILEHVNGKRHKYLLVQYKENNSLTINSNETGSRANDHSVIESSDSSEISAISKTPAKHNEGLRKQGNESQERPDSSPLPPPSPVSPKKSTLPRNGNVVVIVTDNNKHLDKTGTVQLTPVEEISLSGEEVFITKCSFCPQKILGGEEAILTHINSQSHQQIKQKWINFCKNQDNSPNLQDPQLDRNNDTKYFIMESSTAAAVGLIRVVEIPKGAARNKWKFFYWCISCNFRSFVDGIPHEHLNSVFHKENVNAQSKKIRTPVTSGMEDLSNSDVAESNRNSAKLSDTPPSRSATTLKMDSSISNSTCISQLRKEHPSTSTGLSKADSAVSGKMPEVNTVIPSTTNKDHKLINSPADSPDNLPIEIKKIDDVEDPNSKAVVVPKASLLTKKFKWTVADTSDDESAYNIYQVNEDRIKDMETGVLLSFTINQYEFVCLVCNMHYSLQYFYDHLCMDGHLHRLQKMKEEHKICENHPHQWSNLSLAQKYICRRAGNELWCHACQIFLNGGFRALNYHLNTICHTQSESFLRLNATKTWNTICGRLSANFYNTRTYWCVLCQLEWAFETLFRTHLNSKKHKNRMSEFSGKNELIFDYCAFCATLWYGFPQTYFNHLMDEFHRKGTNANIVSDIPNHVERLLCAPEEAVKVIEKQTCSYNDKKKEEQLIRDLESVSAKKYSTVKAYPFGSRITGLGGRKSDLDIFLDCSEDGLSMYFGNNCSNQNVVLRLRNIDECLQGDSEKWRISCVVEKCRVPIIKVTHIPTEIECDVSFTNGITVENTNILRAYCNNHPDCRKLIIFVQNWMEQCKLTTSRGPQGIVRLGMKSYGISWLVIYFLQVKLILPSISELIERRGESKIIRGWETGVSTDFQPGDYNESFRQLLAQFFNFYKDFDYRNDVICPLVGRPVKKKIFQDRQFDLLPSTMKPYIDYLNEGLEHGPLRINSVMCLQDPFDLAHNICKVVSKQMVHKFRILCSRSAQILATHN